MSAILLKWINEELKLSKYVTSFEQDFSSGFLFGEILYRVNQQKNFADFVNSDISDAKIINFCLLEPSFRAIGIKFEPTDAGAVMNAKSGASAKLLYQLKMAIEQRGRSGTVSLRSSQSDGIYRIHNMPARPAKPQYDAKKHSFFETSIRSFVKNQSLEKVATRRVAETTTEQLSQKKLEIANRLDRIREQRLHETNIRREGAKAWSESDILAWEQNMQRRIDREGRIKQFKKRLHQKRVERERVFRDRQRQELADSISKFEETLPMFVGGSEEHDEKSIFPSRKSKTGIGFETSSELYERLQRQDISSDEMEQEARRMMSDIVSKRVIRNAKQTALERRRSRFLKECVFQQNAAYTHYVLDELKNQLLRCSGVEESVVSAVSYIHSFQHVARDDRLHLTRQYEKRSSSDKSEAMVKDATSYQHLRNEIQDDIGGQYERHERTRHSIRLSDRSKVTQLCAEILTSIVSLAHDAADLRKKSVYARERFDFLPLSQWEDLKHIYMLSGNEYNVARLNAAQLEEFCIEISESSMHSNLPAHDILKTLNQEEIPPEYVLGQIIKHCRLVVDPLSPPKPQPDMPTPPLRIVLIGRPFVGRETQGRLLAQRYNLKMIATEELLTVALGNDECQLGHDALRLLQCGKEVTDEIYVQLVIREIKSICFQNGRIPDTSNCDLYAGWVLSDFPNTLQQAQLLEKFLSGYDPENSKPSSNDRASKITPSIVQTGNAEPPAAPLTGKSGIDLVVHIGVGRADTYKRCLGQLCDIENGDTYHMFYQPPPEDSVFRHRLRQAENSIISSSDISLYAAYSDSCLDDMQPWYNDFGILEYLNGSGCKEEELCSKMNDLVEGILSQRAKAGQEAQDRSREERERDELSEEEFRQRLWTVQSDLELVKMEVAAAQEALQEAEANKSNKEEIQALQDVLQEKNDHVQVIRNLIMSIKQEKKLNTEKRDEVASISSNECLRLSQMWNTAEQIYCTCLLKSFDSIRRIRDEVGNYFDKVVNEFAIFLRRPDEKQAILNAFVLDFNQNDLDLRYDDAVKSEFHFRVDTLSDNLWGVIERKADTMENDISQLQEDTTVEDFIASLLKSYLAIIQAECDRFHTATLMLQDASHCIAGTQKVQYGDKHSDLIMPPCVSSIFLDDQVEGKDKKTGKNVKAVETTSEDKVDAATLLESASQAAIVLGEKVIDLFVSKKQDSVIGRNCVSAIQYEFKILQDRVMRTCESAHRACDEVALISSRILSAIKTSWTNRKEKECVAIEAVLKNVRAAIENETELDYFVDIQLRNQSREPILMELAEDTSVQMHINHRTAPDLVPNKHPIVEYTDDRYFSGRQLNEITAALRSAAIHVLGRSDCIPRHVFIDVVSRCIVTPRAVPILWTQCSSQAIERLATYFDNRTNDPNNISIQDVICSLQAKYDVDKLLGVMMKL